MNKLKVGIITFHNADNLGAVLQAYALQNSLETQCGVVAEIIHYQCAGIERGKYPKKGQSLKDKLKWPLMALYYAIKRRGFSGFRRKHLHLSGACDRNTVSARASSYDLFITGSDQVWNRECADFDTTYFLDFVPKDKPTCSYAASLGTYRFIAEEQVQVKTWLDRLWAISVREQSTVRELERIGVEGAMLMPDPVLLLSTSQWERLMPPRRCRQKYVFVYLIQEDVHVLAAAEVYAKAHGCRLIHNKKSLPFILHNSPADFLSWIVCAEAVFTNSFHCTAFSLLFGKHLGADVQLKNGGTNNRVSELLRTCGAEACVLREGQYAGAVCAVAAKIEQCRQEGLAFLRTVCADVEDADRMDMM